MKKRSWGLGSVAFVALAAAACQEPAPPAEGGFDVDLPGDAVSGSAAPPSESPFGVPSCVSGLAPSPSALALPGDAVGERAAPPGESPFGVPTCASDLTPGPFALALQGAKGPDGSGGAFTAVGQIAAGGSHNCAIVEGGQVACWGNNNSGELGDGTAFCHLTPRLVLQSQGGPPLSGVRALALGGFHSCALLDSGEVRCWGHNGYGQLGDGSTAGRRNPVPVLQSPGGPPLSGVKALALGYQHSCALLNSGEVRCWGRNDQGQLGDGTKTEAPQTTPRPVLQSVGGPPLGRVRQIALGGYHSCALIDGGTLRCWGSDYIGQLGDNAEKVVRLTPVPVLQSPGGPPLSGVHEVALGFYTSCARLENGTVECWGDNGQGQLGDGTQLCRLTPEPVRQSPGGPPLSGAQKVTLGGNHGCVLADGGEARCWGANADGRLGDSTQTHRTTPVPLVQSAGGPPLSGVSALALGDQHSCALVGTSEAYCWGANYFGQLGDGTKTPHTTPKPVLFP